jgi:hypothetical protein
MLVLVEIEAKLGLCAFLTDNLVEAFGFDNSGGTHVCCFVVF